MSKQNYFNFDEGETEGETIKLNEMNYNCTECSSPIEILYINEKANIIEFKCTINNHIKKLSIKEYIQKMKKFNNKNINDEVCIADNHNKKYEFFCLDCKKHLCKESIKTRDHINHIKKIIIEIQPSEKELNIMKNIIKSYEDKISNLVKDKFNKTKEMENKLKESENKLKEKNEFQSKENKNIYEKELSDLKDKYKRTIKRYNYDENIENMEYFTMKEKGKKKEKK